MIYEEREEIKTIVKERYKHYFGEYLCLISQFFK